jgi:hypothetical protein
MMIRILLAFVVLIALGCDSESKLDQSVFIPDPLNPELPKYSEFGYNTFGAYHDRAVFASEQFDIPVKVIVENAATQFILKGRRDSGSLSEPMELTFTIPDLDPADAFGLESLHQRKIDLKSGNIAVTIKLGSEAEVPVEIIEGYLEFSRYQKLFVDEQPVQVILSGTFAFKMIVDSEPAAIKSGRFDVGISAGNFFRL